MTDVPWSQTSPFPPAADRGASRGQRRAAQERGGARRGAEGAATMGKTPWSWGPVRSPGTAAVPLWLDGLDLTGASERLLKS